MFALSFKNGNDDPTRDSFVKYYIPLVEIKDFNALIDNKPFFDQPVKTNKCMKNLLKCQEMMTIQQIIYYIICIINSLIIINYYKFIKTSKYEYSSTN